MISADSNDLENALNDFVAIRLPQNCRDAMEQACLLVEADSKRNCPAVDGTLRQSITHSIEDDDNSIVGYVGSNLEYAPYIHHGTGIYAVMGNGRKDVPWIYYDSKKGEYVSTKGIQPTPFIQDAVEKNRADIINYFGGILND